jgi:hypothetical protein
MPDPKKTKKIKPIKLDEAVVSVLSKESYKNLNQAQKQVYDNLNSLQGPKGNKGIKPSYPSIGEGKQIDPITATKMLKDSGVKKILNKPLPFIKSKDGAFRAHTSMIDGGIRVSAPKSKSRGELNKYMRDVTSEAAHLEDNKKHPFNATDVTDFIGRAFSKQFDEKLYKTPGTREHRTHSIVQKELINKYGKKIL